MSKASILLRIIVFLCYTFPFKSMGQNSSFNNTFGGGIPFNYTISSSSKTSAGVYKPDSTLVRTLWSNEQRAAGSFTASWDGKDEDGVLAPDGNYQIRVLSNNITYTWEGVVGNSSKYKSGPLVQHASVECPVDMRIVGKKALYGVNYNEGQSSEFMLNIDSPQVRLSTWNPGWQIGRTGLITAKVCTDGTNFYIAGESNGVYNGVFHGTVTSPSSCVYAKKCSDLTTVIFANGVQHYPQNGQDQYGPNSYSRNNYPSVIDTFHVPDGNNYYNVGGLAVQKTGNLLFVSRMNRNSLHVLNKTTGELIQALTYTAPAYLETDNQNNLWMITGNDVKKYTVNSNGTLTAPTLVLTGLVAPIAMQVTPDGTKLYVMDGGNSQQIKIYDNSTGALLSTFGQVGGYAGNPNVADDKFMFRHMKELYLAGSTNYPNNLPPNNGDGFICFDASNSSYWVADFGNYRMLHFSSNNTLLETISNVGYHYSCSIDHNNPTRVFADYLEFEVDYSKPLQPDNNSWKLKRNWWYNAVSDKDDQFGRLQGITTLSNGRTYAYTKVADKTYIIELSPTGLRYITILPTNTVLCKDGSLMLYNKGQGTQANPTTFQKRALTGFDGNYNPQWGSTVAFASNTDGILLPANDGSSFSHQQTTTSNLMVYFNDEGSGGYHLAAAKAGATKWLWKAAPSTFNQYRGEFPADGTYDIGNLVVNAGGSVQALERSIFWSYKGEFWKNAQTNKYNQYYDNGLMLGQFGITRPEAEETYGLESQPMMAGNTKTAPVVKVGNDYYLYHNDESYHGGVHRWKISGLNTIQEQAVNIVKSGTPPLPAYDYVDLMAGLPFNDTLANNTAGWTRYAPENGSFSSKTNFGTYKKTDRDLRIFSIGQNIDCWVRRDLGSNTGLVNWKITGELSYPEATEYQDNIVEVLDANHKSIVRITRPEYYPNLEIKANKSRIAFGSDVYAAVSRLLPLSIVASGGTITVSFGNYAPVTVMPFDSTANIGNPTLLQLYTVSNPSGHQINVSRLKFYKNFGISLGHFRSKGSGLWKNNSSWQSSADSTNWLDASTTPDSSARSIVIQNGHIITLSDTVTVAHLNILAGGSLKVAPNASLSIGDGPGNDITIAGSASMVLQSDSTGTGRIGPSTGTVAGNITVERYITARNVKAYRMLGPTVNTAGGPKPYIRSNWQEGQNNGTILSNSNSVPNYGIHITGSALGMNGFDATLAATPSMLFYNQTAATPAWVPIANTDATSFDVKKGYLVFVRGDRSTDLNNNSTSSNTTLRTTGTIAIGTQVFTGQEGNGRNSLVTNPYPSPVDWKTIYNDASTTNAANFENYYTYWDPNVGSIGGFITIGANGTKSAATNATTEIQPGQAFFIRAKPGIVSPSFTIKENHKSGAANLGVFRTGPREQFRSALYFTNSNGVRKMADAVNAVFDTTFSASIDGNDAEEMANWDENIGILRAGKMLSIEGRPLIELTDTLQLAVQRLKAQNYEWQFEPMDFTLPNLKAYLEDKYLNLRTQMDLTATKVIPFTVTMDPASSAQDRFKIIFAPNSSLPIIIRSLKAYQKGTGIQVEWAISQENNVDRYEVEKSVDGRQFTKTGTVLPNNAGSLGNSYAWFDQYPKEGNNYYRIKMIDKNGNVTYSSIVNVKIGGKNGGFDIYPNPVVGNVITVQFNNMAAGVYTVNLLNAMGQKIVSRTMNHSGGSASQSLQIDNQLPAGTYTLQITGDRISFNKKIIR